MGVRNCAEIGENLQNIVKRLMANDKLVNLLYYEDKDPLSQQALTAEEKNSKIFEKLIKVVPRIDPKNNTKSVISVRVARGNKMDSNTEFRDVALAVEIIVPFTEWLIKGTNLRPFAILGEIQKSLENKTINGLGKLEGGDFEENFLTDEVGSYIQYFRIVTYD